MPENIEQYLTYQHNVQRYFRGHSEKYQGIVIPLSIATSFPTGTYGFVRALCSRDDDKRYAIDPRTALFQKSWDRSFVRNPHIKMTDVLGSPFHIGLDRPLSPGDFDDELIKKTARQGVEFQLNFRTREEDARKLQKYKKLLDIDTLKELGEPQHVIPPYFQFESDRDPWGILNSKIIQAAISLGHEIPIRPIIHFQSFHRADSFDIMFRGIREDGISAIWLYPNNFHEHDAEVEDLLSYRQTVEAAIDEGLVPYSLFGGYFSILLAHFGLKGFGNGIGYGEWRDSGYHRGGTAVNRVYIYQLHRYLDAPAAQAIIISDPDYFAADSDLLSEYRAAGQSLVSLEQDECLDHFMECRMREVESVKKNKVGELANELRETVKRLSAIGPLELKKYGTSLQKWAEVLEEDKE